MRRLRRQSAERGRGELLLIPIRIFFTKTGVARYISHLDVNRMMQRALKRAELPVWYTEGFNPHMYLTFALPLSLGQESLCESMDLRLNEPVPPEEVQCRLQAALPDGFSVTGVFPPQEKYAAIAAAVYRCELYTEQPETLAADWERFAALPEILTEKKTKRGSSTVDLRPLLSDVKREQGEEALTLTVRLPAGSVSNINPSLILEAFAAHTDQVFYSRILRTGVFTSDGKPFR